MARATVAREHACQLRGSPAKALGWTWRVAFTLVVSSIFKSQTYCLLARPRGRGVMRRRGEGSGLSDGPGAATCEAGTLVDCAAPRLLRRAASSGSTHSPISHRPACFQPSKIAQAMAPVLLPFSYCSMLNLIRGRWWRVDRSKRLALCLIQAAISGLVSASFSSVLK